MGIPAFGSGTRVRTNTLLRTRLRALLQMYVWLALDIVHTKAVWRRMRLIHSTSADGLDATFQYTDVRRYIEGPVLVLYVVA